MPISITNENKNDVTIANTGKTSDITIDEAVGTIDDAGGTIDSPRTTLVRDTKNSLSISNESKN